MDDEQYDFADQMWRERPDDMRAALIRYQQASTSELEKAYAQLIRALAAVPTAVVVCGVLTWLGWACWLVGKWVAG